MAEGEGFASPAERKMHWLRRPLRHAGGKGPGIILKLYSTLLAAGTDLLG